MKFEGRLFVEDRGNGPLALAGLVLAGVGAPLVAFHLPRVAVPIIVLGIVISLWAAARYLVAQGRRAHLYQSLVRADRGVLTIDGKRRFRRLRTAYVQPRDGAPSTVRVRGNIPFDTIDVAMTDEQRAHELLRALGIDPARSIARFRVHAGLFANKKAQTLLSVLLGVSAFQLLNFAPNALKVPVAVLLGVLMLLNLVPSTVSVGPDGVLVTSPTKLRRTFHPFSEIASAEPTEWGVSLGMKSGRTIELRTQRQPLAANASSETRDALLVRIRAGIAAVEGGRTEDVSSLVARGGRPLDEWMRALAALSSEAGGYRATALPAERLWRVVEDPTADPTARAGAAAALRATLDDEGRTRLRVIAESSVHPRVRVALDAVAACTSDHDDRLEEALDACEDDMGHAGT